ncbi:MAG: hypothetical protein ABI693_34230 [Bryobacteraceae bacterium]
MHCLWFTAALLMLSCGHTARTTNEHSAPDRLLEPAVHDRYPNDVGRFLAGLPARSGSSLAALETADAWGQHRVELDRAWHKIDTEGLPAMREFQKRELAGQNPTAPLFYPFSGPDALMMTVFFPRAPVYVMIGLEPAGTLPSPAQLVQKDLETYLPEIRSTVASVLGRSFFITRQMDRQFRGQVTDGLLVPILQMLVRSGHTILGLRYVRLDDAGKIIERAADYKAPGHIGDKGVELEIRRDDDQSIHKLFYFSVNLSDERLRQNPQFVRFSSTLQGTTTYLKATSYMTHHPDFSIIRNIVLSRSMAVLQDDSGIPYQLYKPPWRVQLYGEYVRAYGSFKWLEQPDLRNAYLVSKPRPLPFRIGYGYGRVESNLLFATKAN